MPPSKMTFRSFKHCNVDELNSNLSEAPWPVIDVFDDINDKWDCWKKLFCETVEKHAPVIIIRQKKVS